MAVVVQRQSMSVTAACCSVARLDGHKFTVASGGYQMSTLIRILGSMLEI